jgi:6-phosphogluconolactonase (cycloisomerase 2 family)
MITRKFKREKVMTSKHGLTSVSILLLLATLAACSGGSSGSSGSIAAPQPDNVPRFAYVANFNDNTVSIYTVNASTGQLGHNGYVTAGTHPSSIVVDPAGKHAYVANNGSNDISVYSINPNSGMLSAVGVPVSTGGTVANSFNVDPSGKYAYVLNYSTNNISMYTINALTGELSSIGSVSTGLGWPFSMTIDPTGRFAYVAMRVAKAVAAYEINATTGVLTEIDQNGAAEGTYVPAENSPDSVSIHPSGKFVYVANNSSNSVSAYSVNSTTGALTPIDADSGVADIQSFPAGTAPSAISIDPSGKFAYVSNQTSNDVSAYSIDFVSGMLTRILCSGGAAVCNGNDYIAGADASSVTIDPSGKFVYVANYISNNVSTYSINATTGALIVLSNVAGRSGNFAMAMTHGTAMVSNTPKFAYVANSFNGAGGNSISAYSINAVTGALTSVGLPVAAGTNPNSVTVDPRSRFAYVASWGSDNISAYTINASTGVLTSVGLPVAAGLDPGSVAVDPSGRFAYAVNANSANISAYTINPTSGALTPIICSGTCSGSNFPAGTFPQALSIDPSGQFAFVANFGSNNVVTYRIDAMTGALTSVGTVVVTGPLSVTVHPSGKFVYVANGNSNTLSAFTIDALSGALTEIDTNGTSVGSAVAAGAYPVSVTVDPSGKFAYLANGNSNNIWAYTINTTSGVLTPADIVATENFPDSITVEPSGKFVYATNFIATGVVGSVSTYAINTTTGELNRAGTAVATGIGPGSITTTATFQ